MFDSIQEWLGLKPKLNYTPIPVKPAQVYDSVSSQLQTPLMFAIIGVTLYFIIKK